MERQYKAILRVDSERDVVYVDSVKEGMTLVRISKVPLWQIQNLLKKQRMIDVRQTHMASGNPTRESILQEALEEIDFEIGKIVAATQEPGAEGKHG